MPEKLSVLAKKARIISWLSSGSLRNNNGRRKDLYSMDISRVTKTLRDFQDNSFGKQKFPGPRRADKRRGRSLKTPLFQHRRNCGVVKFCSGGSFKRRAWRGS